MSKSEPTIIPVERFGAQEDATSLHAASKGEEFINILCRRSNAQRIEIAKAYKTLFGEDLTARLQKKTSGKFRTLLVALVTPLPEFYAQELHDAIEGLGTDEAILIETLITLSNNGIHAVSKSYEKLFGKTLEQDIVGDTTGDFKKLCVSLAQGRRDEDTHVTVKAAKEDAQKLIEAGVEKWGTEESVFNSILVAKNFEHLEQVFIEYHALAGHPIETAIEKEFSGVMKKAYLALIKCVRNKYEYFAELLHKSMKGLGTNDKTLIRIIVARSEIDLGSIRQAFNNLYPDSNLGTWIHDDTSGDYRSALLAIAGY